MLYSISSSPILTILIYLLLYLSLGLCASQLAKYKNRSQMRWFILGFLFGLIVLIILCFLPSLPADSTAASNNHASQDSSPSMQQDNVHLNNSSPLPPAFWWYHLESSRHSVGPLSYEELIVFLKEKSLTQSREEIEKIWLWKKGMQEWKQIKDIQEIKEALQ